MPPADLIFDAKRLLHDGSIVQIRIWRLPRPDAERPHGFKYSFYYGRAGERIVAYDNERGKGDHRHYRQREEAYCFVSIEQALADFEADVQRDQDS